MLPVFTVPSCLLSVLEGVRGVFTAWGFATFTSLMTGLLGATGSRTVTGMWSATGLAGRSHHARAHRFFSHARWDLDSLGLLVARLVVARFVPARGGVDGGGRRHGFRQCAPGTSSRTPSPSQCLAWLGGGQQR
jgi:DDE superfamily endonuclease